MAGKTQSEVTRRSERDRQIISGVGTGAVVFICLPLFFLLRNLGWSPEAAMYAGLVAGAPVFGGLIYWVWRRNISTESPGTRKR
jgi:hypothetical protein